MTTTTDTRPTLDPTTPVPSTNPYEPGKMFTTVECPTAGCTHRVSVDPRDLEGLLAGSVVVMHTSTEHWTRVYWGSDPARAQYRA